MASEPDGFFSVTHNEKEKAMFLDKQNIFSDKQAVAATGLDTDTVDLGKGDAGPTEGVSLFVGADGCTGTGTIVVELQTADACAAGGALTSPVTIATYPVGNEALKAGGKIVAARLPHGMKRYAGVNYVVTGAVTGLKLTAGLVMDV